MRGRLMIFSENKLVGNAERLGLNMYIYYVRVLNGNDQISLWNWLLHSTDNLFRLPRLLKLCRNHQEVYISVNYHGF